MSFPFGDRSSFRERTKGKSGDEILDDMLKNIKQRKKEFFEAPPKWRPAGMFDDDLNTPGGSRFESRLGDLASRHPDLADHFYDFPSRKFGTIPREQGKTEETKSTQQPDLRTEANKYPETTTIGTQTGGLESDTKLRNTVPDMQTSTGDLTSDNDRGQRSQSAPPQTPSGIKQQKDGVRLIPINTDTPSGGVPLPGRQIPRLPEMKFSELHSHYPPSQQQHFQHSTPSQPQFTNDRHHEEPKGPTVRHIPIYVEGRDEPILPKDACSSNTTKRGGCQGKTEPAPPKRGPPYEEKKEHQPQQNSEPQQQTQQETHAAPPPPSRPDPLAVVADVIKDVEALSARVNDWKGNSRTEKEYVYLDEMLTRNLLKLDNIETEGREELRTARKEAIRRVQAAISILESKAANEDATMALAVIQGSDASCNSGQVTEEKVDEPMETDSTLTEASHEAGNISQSQT